MQKIAIIPARGGSKRLPRKNILPVLGKPMLSYPVAAALESQLFDQVIVSTEDEEIRSVALQSGARVMGRPENLARDRSTVAQVCQNVIEVIGQKEETPPWFCCIYATAVFLTSQDLTASFQLLDLFPEANVIMGVSRYNLQPVQALAAAKNGFLAPQWPEYKGVQSQFHPDLVASNGTLYWAKTKDFLKNRTFYTDKLAGYEIPWIRAIDLDTPEDYETARLMAPLLLNGGV